MKKGMPMSMDKNLTGCYGSRVLTSEVKNWLIANITDNMDRAVRVTLNIWSTPGVGKTSLVKSLAGEPVIWNGKTWDGYEIIDIPLAQIEEMGDVLGFPVEEIRMTDPSGKTVWIKAVDALIKDYLEKGYTTDGTQRTQYARPSWAPVEERPGILLFDDGNRASQRIMKGLMQLVQDYRTISWEIPRGWTIIFTGNPDNRMNQVTTMDSAQLSRMKHITLLPDVREWGIWAEAQPDLDKRLIAFVLQNPEMLIAGERTNPRSLSEFGRALKRFPDLADRDQLNRCRIEAEASLDSEVVDALMIFLSSDDVGLVIDPDDILSGKGDIVGRVNALFAYADPRLDIINLSSERLLARMLSPSYKFEPGHAAGLKSWLFHQLMPADIRLVFLNRLATTRPILIAQLLRSIPELKSICAELKKTSF